MLDQEISELPLQPPPSFPPPLEGGESSVGIRTVSGWASSMEHLDYYIPDNMRLWKHKTRSKNIPFYETNIVFLTLLITLLLYLGISSHPSEVPARWRSSSTVPRRKGYFSFKAWEVISKSGFLQVRKLTPKEQCLPWGRIAASQEPRAKPRSPYFWTQRNFHHLLSPSTHGLVY